MIKLQGKCTLDIHEFFNKFLSAYDQLEQNESEKYFRLNIRRAQLQTQTIFSHSYKA